ncbi:hypothetical protein QA943_18685 [Streptomyces sp. B21-097]|uniref:hypothetical protein n=1 Tax=Streptomyces sp. B21-097 TaxID=3039414 RepID=UPI002FF347A5
MIRPTLTVDGTAVRLPVTELAARILLDDLAVSYAADPDAVASLLASHAVRVMRLDYANHSDAPDHICAMRSAEADASRDELLDQCPNANGLDELLTPDEAVTLAGRLTKHAAHIRHTTQNGNPRT